MQNATSNLQQSKDTKNPGCKLREYEKSCSNRGIRTQAKGNPSQPGGPSTEGPADFYISHHFGCWEILEKTGTENDEDLSKNFLKILDTVPIFTWKHETDFW